MADKLTKKDVGELLLLLMLIPGLQERIVGPEPTVVTKMW
jgi:hypothetical protein